MKERVLTKKLDAITQANIEAKYHNLSNDELKRKKKELIMETYMNMVFLGNNTYGVETAANTYFAKSVSELTLLEGAILAGIIQAPGRYNLYTNKVWNQRNSDLCDPKQSDTWKEKGIQILCQGTVGGLTVFSVGSTGEDTSSGVLSYATKKFADAFLPLDLNIASQNKAFYAILDGKDMTFNYNNTIYTMKYLWGRKDTVLSRMYSA